MEAKPMESKPLEVKPEFGELEDVYGGIIRAIEKISDIIRNESLEFTGSNEFGDNQLNLDVDCNTIIYNSLKETGVVAYALSEESPTPTELGGGDYIVTLDPLDGSSVISTNFSVGSIFAIWPNKNKLIGLKGRDMVGAMISVYGPRTDVIYYNPKDKRVDQIKLLHEKWVT